MWNELHPVIDACLVFAMVLIICDRLYLGHRHRLAKAALIRLRKERNQAQTDLANLRLGTRR